MWNCSLVSSWWLQILNSNPCDSYFDYLIRTKYVKDKSSVGFLCLVATTSICSCHHISMQHLYSGDLNTRHSKSGLKQICISKGKSQIPVWYSDQKLNSEHSAAGFFLAMWIPGLHSDHPLYTRWNVDENHAFARHQMDSQGPKLGHSKY